MEDVELSILTWNIWTTGHASHHRMQAVAELIDRLSPDVVGLQEVEWSSLDAFAQWEWWERYTCNVNARRHRRHADADYYVLLLLKRSTFSKVSRYAFRGFPNTVMGRGLLIVDAEAHGSAFRFATTHLDSPGGNGEGMSDIRAFLNHVREVQAQQSWELLGRGGREAFIFGDMNWIDEEQGPCPLAEGWRDVWLELKPASDPGYTYDCQSNRMMGPRVAANRYRSRLDRVWFCTRTWQPEHVRIVGDQRIRGKVCLDLKNRYSGEHLPLLPSDHYGLYTRFRKA